MGRNRILFCLAAGLGSGAFLGCSSSRNSTPISTPAVPPAFVGTVAALVAAPNADSADPMDVDALNLQGLDTAEDDTVFNGILGN